ncbi:MAG: hypothetical protein RL189_201 [Pseudomonadota bacterium]
MTLNAINCRLLSAVIVLIGSCFAKMEAGASPQVASGTSACPPMDRTKLMRLLEDAPEKRLNLVFFSGWCSDCSAHLKKINDSSAILVGIFDNQARIEKVVARMRLANRCYTDSGLGKLLEVKTVPAERFVTLDSLRKVPR